MEPPAAERRIVTVLFADIVGFTSLSERLDAEDVAALQEAYFAIVRETVGRHGGRIEKFIGDAVMAVFGIPRTREDDAERAVRAGLALAAATEALGARLGLEAEELRLRVGIDTGEVVYQAGGADDWRVTGDTVNVASRLQGAAPAGAVMLGEQTALAVAAVVELGDPVTLELKGKREPVRAALAVGIGADRSRERAMGRLRAPLVGREADLAWFSDALASIPAGASTTLLVVGPPGVGKTRFVSAAAAAAVEDGSVGVALVGRVLPEGGPYDPVRDLLRAASRAALADGGDAPDAEALAARLATAQWMSPARGRVVAGAIADLLGGAAAPGRATAPTSDDERELRMEAWLDGFDALAPANGVAWVVEDVHWAGPDALRVLGEAGRRGPRGGGRRMVLATVRPTAAERIVASSEGWTAAGRRDLAPLAPGSASELVRALVGQALPDALVDGIAERSDGNPLFIEEVLRSWVAAGILESHPGGGWRLTIPPTDVGIPPSIQAIYAAQIDDLSADSRAIVRRASVSGRAFPSGALPVLGVEHPREGLETLLAGAVVTGPRPGPTSGEHFAYRHALLRDAGYASLTRSDRARLHVRLARWLEAVAGSRVDEIADVIGRHYADALASLPALATSVDEGLHRAEAARLAATWLERGGERAIHIGAVKAAATGLAQALALTPEDARLDRARRLVGLAEATAAAADMDEAVSELESAVALLREVRAGSLTAPEAHEARRGLARAADSLGRIWYDQIRFRDGAELCAAVIDELGSDGGGEEDLALARVRLRWARCEYAASSRDTSPEILEVHAAAVRAGDRLLELDAMWGAIVVTTELGLAAPFPEAKVEALARELGDWSALQSQLVDRGLEQADDHPAAALPILDEAAAISETHGLTEGLGWTEYARSEALCVTGDLDAAVAACERALTIAEANAYRRIVVRTNHVLVPIAMARGDRAPAIRLEAFYDSLPGPFPDSFYARVIRAAMDLWIADAGAGPAVVPDVQPRLAAFDAPGGGASWVLAVERVVRCWLEGGEIDGAREAVRRLRLHLDHPAQTQLARGTTELLTAQLALREDDATRAAHEARAALERFRATPAPWWVLKALRALDAAGEAGASEREEADRLARELRVRA